MAIQRYELEFKGYYREDAAEAVPTGSGVYCVYAGSYDRETNKAALDRIIYIGEAGNIQSRIKSYATETSEEGKALRARLKGGEELLFSVAGIKEEYERIRAQAALIFKVQPPVNTHYKGSFPFDDTIIRATGDVALLPASFGVQRTP